MIGDDGVICPATKVGLTVTVLAGEHVEAGVFEESVALYENMVFVFGEAVRVFDVPLVMSVVQAPSEYHRYDSGEVPCEA